MANDLLAPYRRKTSSLPGAEPPPEEPDEYVAFKARDKVHRRLRIRGRDGIQNSPLYDILVNVTFDYLEPTEFILTFRIMEVTVKGRNLTQLVAAIEDCYADFIQEFDPNRWDKPTDTKEAIIESIKVVVEESNSASGRPSA